MYGGVNVDAQTRTHSPGGASGRAAAQKMNGLVVGTKLEPLPGDGCGGSDV